MLYFSKFLCHLNLRKFELNFEIIWLLRTKWEFVPKIADYLELYMFREVSVGNLKPNCEMSRLQRMYILQQLKFFFHHNQIKIGMFSKSLINIFGAFQPVLCYIRKLAKIYLLQRKISSWQAIRLKMIIGFVNKLWIKKSITILEITKIFLIRRSIACHDAFSLGTATHHLVQRIEV